MAWAHRRAEGSPLATTICVATFIMKITFDPDKRRAVLAARGLDLAHAGQSF
jgi:hypothetical protein